MKVLRNLKCVNQVALVALALCFSAALGKAQNAYEGKFTLPFAAQWAGAVLPAGDYTISMPDARAPYLLYLRGQGKTVIVMSRGTNMNTVSKHSQLTLANTAGKWAVTRLEAGQLGLTFDYGVAKATTTAPEIAQVPVRAGSTAAGGR